jgi:phospholipase/carboxylesterase
VLGGFSMGTVMSYALGLSGDRPAPAGILAFSGFVPTVEGWEPSLEDRQQLRVFIAHGRRDPVIDISLAHRARDFLIAGGLNVEYHEHEGSHHIDPRQLELGAHWVADTLGI